MQIYALQILKFTLVIFMSLHYIGCIFYWLSVYFPANAGASDSEVLAEQQHTWIQQLENVFPPFHIATSSLAEKYLIVLYRGALGISNLSYHLSVPRTTQECVVFIIVMCYHACLSAFILGTMFHHLMRKNPAEEALTQLQHDLTIFSCHWALPSRLQAKLLSFIKFQHQKGWSTSTFSLPRSMEIQVADALFRPTIEKSWLAGGLLDGCSPQYLDTLLMSLHEVYLMPGEEVLRAGQSSMQLCFVVSGSVEEIHGEVVKNVIRSDVDKCASFLTLSFFFGISEVYTVRATNLSDVRLLVLGIDASEKIHREFPDQQEIIRSNILYKYGLDHKGRDISASIQIPAAISSDRTARRHLTIDDSTDEEKDRIREALVETVKKRTMDSVLALMHAADRGDADEVRRLVRSRGVDINWTDYDGRSILHYCASQGKYRIIEVLLEEGADKNALDRWNRSPLQDAVNGKHFHVVDVLNRYNAKMSTDDEGGLCDAAGAGNLDAVRHLIKGKADPSKGDYDSRTPLHVAAANGHDKIVEFLLHKDANVNARDRWDSTPLYDAIKVVSNSIVSTIVKKGGTLPDKIKCSEMCNAAADGDVRKLRMLMDCGLTPEVMDYDLRTPLHLAAAGAKILAVSFLLAQGADPCFKDRWGQYPLDDALRGGTLYHLYSAKLIRMNGGTLSGTEEEQRAGIETLDSIDIQDVRSRVKQLLTKGVDRRKPTVLHDCEVTMSFESTLALIEPIIAMRELFVDIGSQLKGQQGLMRDVQKDLLHMVDVLIQHEDVHLSTVFAQMRRTQFLERLEDKDEFDGTTWLDSIDEVSEEEYKLYKELDALELANPMTFGKAASRIRARELQRIVLRLSDVATMHSVLVEVCSQFKDSPSEAALTIDGMFHVLSIFLSVFLPASAVRATARALLEEVGATGDPPCVPLKLMLSHSEKFRDMLMNEENKMKVILGAMSLPRIFSWLSYTQHMVLSAHCSLKVLEHGQTVSVDDRCFYIVVGGSLCRLDKASEEDVHGKFNHLLTKMLSGNVTHDAATDNEEWHAGSVLGELAVLTGFDTGFNAACTNRCVLVEVPRHIVAAVLLSQPRCIIKLSRSISTIEAAFRQTKELFKSSSELSKTYTTQKGKNLVAKILFLKENYAEGSSKANHVCSLFHIFHMFPEMNRGEEEEILPAKLSFFFWKGIMLYHRSTTSYSRSRDDATAMRLQQRQSSRSAIGLQNLNTVSVEKITSIVRDGLRLVNEC